MGGPRIHLYMPCWNEAAILPHFFRHYSFVERFVIFDNGSTDESRALVGAEPRAELREFDTAGEIDERAYLRIKNEAWKESRGRADFVIVCDTDEFLFHPAIDAVLAQMRATGATMARPAGYDMVAARPPRPGEDLLRTVTDGVRKLEFDKSVLFDPLAIEEIHYDVGAHICSPRGKVRLYARPGLALLHYKNLGFDYVRRRLDAVAPRVGAWNRSLGLAAGYAEDAQQTRRRLRMLAHLARPVVPPPEAPPPPIEPPDDLDVRRAAALAAAAAGDWRVAQDGLEQVLAWRPDDVDALGGLGVALRRLGRSGDALWCFRRALVTDPGRADIWFAYGELMLAGRSHRQAAICFRHAVRRRADHPEAWGRLAEALAALGDSAGAEGARREAVARAPAAS